VRFKATIWNDRKDACTSESFSRKIYLRHTENLSIDGAGFTLIDIHAFRIGKNSIHRSEIQAAIYF